jgi:glycine/D-amino acid oxidase-like deaminating enzyme
MTKYVRSFWLDQFPKSRVPAYPRYRGPREADAVVIGGGLTGCATAYALAAAGMKPLVLEADQIGRGGTAFASGWIADDPGVTFGEIEREDGLRNARKAWQAWRRAARDFSSLLRRLDIKCHLEPKSAVTVAVTPDEIARLKKDRQARIAAGVDTPAVNARAIRGDAAVDGGFGLRARDNATIDPYRASLGLAAAAIQRGAEIYERSPVRRITFTRKHADVFTADGTIRTHHVLVTTGLPTALFHSLARHFWFRSTYFALTEPLPAKVRRQLGRPDVVLRDSVQPPHIVRWIDDERVLIGGADGPTAPARQRDKVAVQRTGQLMYELSTLYPDVSGALPEYGWIADYARTADGLPYIGAHRNFPFHVFAFGGASQSVTGSYLASRILLRHCSGEMDPSDQAFGFHR